MSDHMKKLLVSNEGHEVHTQWFLSLGSLCRQEGEIRETTRTGSCSVDNEETCMTQGCCAAA